MSEEGPFHDPHTIKFSRGQISVRLGSVERVGGKMRALLNVTNEGENPLNLRDVQSMLITSEEETMPELEQYAKEAAPVVLVPHSSDNVPIRFDVGDTPVKALRIQVEDGGITLDVKNDPGV